MKKILLIVTVAFFCLGTKAQFLGGIQAGVAHQSAPSFGHLYGKIVDNNGKAISDASIILLQSRMDTASKKLKDILLKGTATKNNGQFSLEVLIIIMVSWAVRL